MGPVPALRPLLPLAILLVAGALTPSPLAAQSIRGRLLDSESGRPIDLGILALLTLDADTVDLAATTPDGSFTLSAPEPGTFLVHASAFGYTPRQEGEFELGVGGRLDVEFRIAPLALALDDMIVSVDRPRPNHPLIRNGFVTRYQQGLGRFITPRDLERTVFANTEAIFSFVPGVRVSLSQGFATEDRVTVRGPFGWCRPTVYVDGVRTAYRPEAGATLSSLAPVGWIEAVEIYRGPLENPPQYPAVGDPPCGVILIWLKPPR